MRVLIAGATGVIGRQAVPRLAAAGHEVIALSRGGAAPPPALGVAADLLDAEATAAAVRQAAPDVVVHVATAIPDPLDPRRFARDMAQTNRLRTAGTANLVAAAGGARMIAEGYAPVYDPAGPPVCDEDQPLWRDPPRQAATTIAALRELERRVVDADGLVLRFGHLYGPGTTFAADGATLRRIRKGRMPIVGDGGAMFSFLHPADAAAAIVAAVESDATGVVNVADDDPAPVREWLPEVAGALGAPEPRRIPAWLARVAAGPYGVAFMTALRGADTHRAHRELSFRPQHPTWRAGLAGDAAPAALAA